MTENQPQQEECPPPRTSEAVDCWLRKWGRDAVVDGKEPLTRQDVERLIEANGGTAERLDLSGRNLNGSDLSGLILNGINLHGAHLGSANLQEAYLERANLQEAHLGSSNLQGAQLWYADLQGARLWSANLQGANLWGANLQGARLWSANLQGANLWGANLQGAYLHSARLYGATSLQNARWGDHRVGEERGKWWDGAMDVYRSLKTWHQEHGIYDIAGEFHHREMVCQRKATFPKLFGHLERKPTWLRLVMSVLPSIALMLLAIPLAMLFFWARRDQKFKPYWSYDLLKLARFTFYEQLFGYGERPWRVVRAAVIVVLGLALAYRFFGTFAEPVGFINALYFSAVSFSALGYGQWSPVPEGWAKYMGVAESFLGVFTIALFLVTFTRKMVR